MQRLLTALLMSLFLGSASATHVYHGWAKDNPDLSGHSTETADFAAMEIREDDSVNIYHGIDRGNRDLYTPPTASGDFTRDPDIYQGFRGASDLTW